MFNASIMPIRIEYTSEYIVVCKLIIDARVGEVQNR